VMGDLNVPAHQPQHYGHMLNTLAGIQDCWTIVGNSPESGPTSIRDSNFFEDSDDRPEQDTRLDYVLIRAGTGAVPIVLGTEVLRFTRNGRLISDHLAVRAAFDRMALVRP
jgi:endonuclease/exonuclease/phosphatase family metal-dependent hydrolase